MKTIPVLLNRNELVHLLEYLGDRVKDDPEDTENQVFLAKIEQAWALYHK